MQASLADALIGVAKIFDGLSVKLFIDQCSQAWDDHRSKKRGVNQSGNLLTRSCMAKKLGNQSLQLAKDLAHHFLQSHLDVPRLFQCYASWLAEVTQNQRSGRQRLNIDWHIPCSHDDRQLDDSRKGREGLKGARYQFVSQDTAKIFLKVAYAKCHLVSRRLCSSQTSKCHCFSFFDISQLCLVLSRKYC